MRALSNKVIYKQIQVPVRIVNVVNSSINDTGRKNACPKCEKNLSKIDFCRECDQEIANKEIKSKYEITKTEYRIFTEEELEELNKSNTSIRIIGQIPKEKLSNRIVVGCFYILPKTNGKTKAEKDEAEDNKKHYAILRESIVVNDKLFLVKFAQKTKERLGILGVEDGCIVLYNIAYNEYVREQDENVNDLGVELDESKRTMATKLIEAVPQVELNDVKHTYKEKLEEILSGNPEPQAQEEVVEDMWGSL